jgi:ornithine carbamoyltransferase
MSRMCDVIMIRTYGQEIIERFAKHSRVPVINGLTNEQHPCQVLADVFTYIEHRGSIQGKIVAWVGDANNMLYSWLQAAEVFGFHVNVSTPKGYDIDRPRSRRATSTTPSSPIRPMPARTPTWSPPTCGPAWASRPRTMPA